MNYCQEFARLKARKLEQTREKIETEGILDEDRHGPSDPHRGVWRNRPTHPD